MTNIRLMRLILALLSVMLLSGVTLTTYMLNEYQRENGEGLDVYIGDSDNKVVTFEDLSLIPGEQCEYTVTITSATNAVYDISLELVELSESSLKNYAYIRAEYGKTVLFDCKLSDIIGTGSAPFTVDFTESDQAELYITYYLPETVGNEAQETDAFFELHIASTLH